MMAVRIDETGSEHQPLGVEDLVARPCGELADGGDAPVANGDIGDTRRCTGAIDDGCVLDEPVGASLGCDDDEQQAEPGFHPHSALSGQLTRLTS